MSFHCPWDRTHVVGAVGAVFLLEKRGSVLIGSEGVGVPIRNSNVWGRGSVPWGVLWVEVRDSSPNEL